jgi:hypothetical protein
MMFMTASSGEVHRAYLMTRGAPLPASSLELIYQGSFRPSFQEHLIIIFEVTVELWPVFNLGQDFPGAAVNPFFDIPLIEADS